MNLGEVVAFLSRDPIAYACLQGVFWVSLADFVLGTLKALAPPSTFSLKWVDAWVGDHLFKAAMITFALIFGYLAPPITVGDFSLNGILLAAEAAAATYILKTGTSAVGNLNFRSPDEPPESVIR